MRTIGSREPAVTIAFAFHLASLLTSLAPLAVGFPGVSCLGWSLSSVSFQHLQMVPSRFAVYV